MAVPRDDCVDKGDENAVQSGSYCKCKKGFEYWSTSFCSNCEGMIKTKGNPMGRWSTVYHGAGRHKCELKSIEKCKGDENAVQVTPPYQNDDYCKCKPGFEYFASRWSDHTKYNARLAGTQGDSWSLYAGKSVKCQVAVPRYEK